MYQATADRRSLIRNSTEDYVAHWNALNAIASKHPHLQRPLRDTHCREAVMWWVHHLTEAQREEMRVVTNATVPLLPESDTSAVKEEACGSNGTDEEDKLCVHLEQPNSCDWCHSTQVIH